MPNSLPYIEAENFLLHKESIRHGFGTKQLGDDVSKLAQVLEVDQENIITLNQTHSSEVIVVEKNFDTKTIHDGDALITDQKGKVLVIRTADCLPVLLCDPRHDVVAAVHAGWKGLVGQILFETIRTMNHIWGTEVQNLQVAFGPSILPHNYQVGEEVFEAFWEVFGMNFSYEKLDDGKACIDLAHTAAMNLEQLGLHHRNFFFIREGTFSRPDLFYSYRRDKEKAERQLNFIVL